MSTTRDSGERIPMRLDSTRVRRAASGSVQTAFGLLDGRLVDTTQVARGLACGCVCPGCGAALVARQGDTRAWCFAHHGGEGVASCAESALHAAAKQVLQDSRAVAVPQALVRVAQQGHDRIWRSREQVLSPARTIRFDRCDVEVPLENMVADVVCHRGERRMVIEVFVTHRVDDDKAARLAALDMTALEIDLSDLAASAAFVDFAIVRRRVLEQADNKRWLHYPGFEAVREALAAELADEVAALDAHAPAHVRRAAEWRARDDAAYRALPVEEQERRLRRALSIDGAWPAHLDDCRFTVPALAIPTRVWQGLVYAQFVLAPPRAPAFAVDDVIAWVGARFDCSLDDERLRRAIRGFLAFMCARHFLKREASGHGDFVRYRPCSER